MKMSEEMAVRLHRMMWSDMQKEFGDRPYPEERFQFKADWIRKHFPSESINNDCWLCEYASSVADHYAFDPYCKHCPISWPGCHCNTLGFSYAKAPISEILALPAKNGIAKVEDYISIAKKAESISDLPRDIDLNEVRKNLKDAIGTLKLYQSALSHESDFPASAPIADHIKAIQEKAVEDYFKKTPGAKLATMDVDNAFKQYAEEQKAPIFRALAEASGLSAGNESVKDHISEIRSKAKYSGRKEAIEEIFKSLSICSDVSPDIWAVGAHVDAIREKASNEKDMEILRKTSMQLADKVDRYKDALSKESDLDRNRPVDDHIREIVRNSMEAGATDERERIMDKIGEMLKK